MARVIGIDPGTVSFDLCGLEDGQVFDRLTDRDIMLACLPRDRGQTEGVVGLRRIFSALQIAHLPVVFTPGVVHLPTVPAYRKANRLDMGTADKVCAAALAIDDQAPRFGLKYEMASFVLVELGGAFSAVLAVQDGRIVDGAGGSSGPMGYRALGAMDGELAYLLGRFSKAVLLSGGAAYLAGSPDLPPEQLGSSSEGAACGAREALVEAMVKAVAAEHALVPEAREILLSGRLTAVQWIAPRLREELSRFAPVRVVSGFARVAKEAAQGAALIADGLAGGSRRGLVEAMQIQNASGTVFDNLFVAGAEQLVQRLAE